VKARQKINENKLKRKPLNATRSPVDQWGRVNVASRFVTCQ